MWNQWAVLWHTNTFISQFKDASAYHIEWNEMRTLSHYLFIFIRFIADNNFYTSTSFTEFRHTLSAIKINGSLLLLLLLLF